MGSSSVGIIGGEDKRGCTVMFGVKASGDVLPMQRQRANDGGHHITTTRSHWCTEESYKQWIEKIVVPDYLKTCEFFKKTPYEQWMILKVDAFSVHISDSILTWLQDTYPFIKPRFVPAGCTPVAQVPDTFVNRPFKHHIRVPYDKWCVAEIRAQLQTTGTVATLPSYGILKLWLASLEWILDAWEHVGTMRGQIVDAYRKRGVAEVEKPPLNSDEAAGPNYPTNGVDDPDEHVDGDDFYAIDPETAAQAADYARLMCMSDLDLVNKAAKRFAGMSEIAALRATAMKRMTRHRAGGAVPKKAATGAKRGRSAGSKNKKEAVAPSSPEQPSPIAHLPRRAPARKLKRTEARTEAVTFSDSDKSQDSEHSSEDSSEHSSGSVTE
ncbi:hypothetical protein FOA52_009598 [Chlamydomonas sp. UWO 241]|nr:hypothetical protein FOA52_009598 [Chlamydomonas sp. UWO 241]